MVARITKRQRQEKDALKRLPQELLNKLRASSRPKPKLGVSDWQERWRRKEYQGLALWRIAWGLLRHDDEYWYNWAFDIGPRWARDGSVIAATLTDNTEWASKFGLRHALNPALSAFQVTENPFRSIRARRSLRVIRGPGEVNVALRPNQAIVVINLSLPVAPQLAAAKRHLKPQSLTPSRLRRKEYPQYLCALDGKAAGASLAEIGRAFKPTSSLKERKDTARNYLRAAASLELKTYQAIAEA